MYMGKIMNSVLRKISFYVLHPLYSAAEICTCIRNGGNDRLNNREIPDPPKCLKDVHLGHVAILQLKNVKETSYVDVGLDIWLDAGMPRRLRQ